MAHRWIRQRNNYSCGPVAIMNLLKWLGESVTYANDYAYWLKQCKTAKYGTSLYNFTRVLYNLDGIKISPRNVPNIGVIDEALLNGRAVVMKSAYISNDVYEGHYYLITDCTDKSYYCVNLNDKHGWVSKPSFKNQWLQHHTNYCYECGIAPYAWIVRKI
jgi:predicted double-glycine peptidase